MPNIDAEILALRTARQGIHESVYGETMRGYITDQCDATENLAIKLNDDLDEALAQSFAIPDTTLSQEGKPADAKAAGDAIANINAELENYVDNNHAKISYDLAVGYLCEADGNGSMAVGARCVAGSPIQFVHGRNPIVDTNGDYLEIVGAGTDFVPKNVYTLDLGGNAWYSGTVKIGGTSYADASEVATKAYVDSLIGNAIGGSY